MKFLRVASLGVSCALPVVLHLFETHEEGMNHKDLKRQTEILKNHKLGLDHPPPEVVRVPISNSPQQKKLNPIVDFSLVTSGMVAIGGATHGSLGVRTFGFGCGLMFGTGAGFIIAMKIYNST